MKKNILICNVGNRDVQFAQGENEFPKNNFREVSKKIYGQYEEKKENLHFPIITTILLDLTKRIKKLNIHEILLIATDQNPPHFSDTLYSAQLIRKYLLDTKDDRKIWGGYLNQLKKPKIIAMQNNPSNMDDMYKFYSEQLPQILGDLDQYQNIFFSITGGTPAMNTMLMIHGINVGKDKAQIVYVPNKSGRSRNLNITGRMLLENHLLTIRQNIQHFEYHSAIQYLENNQEFFASRFPIKMLQNLICIFKYAFLRISFQFGEALEFIGHFSESRDDASLENLYDYIRDLTEHNVDDHVDKYMAELYWNINMLYSKGQFIDVCLRLFRFQEQSLREFVKRKLGVVLDEKVINQEWLKNNTGLRAYLEKSKIRYQGTITRATLQETANYYIQNQESALNPILSKINLFDELSTLRNNCIGAHGFSGITEEKMYELMQNKFKLDAIEDFKEALFSTMKEIYTAIFENDELLTENQYEQMNQVIFKQLDKMSKVEVE
ncbi:hypothetical protein [Cytobacillus dafuensis]|uniref:CRISPR-associated protein n=1 Tax=Cytobacillus dafuensis TaxID=1742359 RepID=A0A5B8Z5H8_CYTDA|nr:hypothetical protein [Cytobacillus dafuensis]QED48147.1 hypothetical protein FSZ17_13390 [Cytobacillus dafuensis]